VVGSAGLSRRDGRRRVFLIGAAALLVVLLARGRDCCVRGRGSAVHVNFPVAVVGGNLAVHRSYELDGDTLTTKVRLTSIATSTADVSFSEVVPESVARSVTGLRDVEPANPRVLQADPVLLFTFSRVSPGDTREISYRAMVTGSDPPATRLARLEGDQQAAEASFDRQNAIVVSQLQTLTITVTQTSDFQSLPIQAAASCKTAVPASPDSLEPVPASRFFEEHRPLPGCNLSSPRAFAPPPGQVPGPLPVPDDATSAFRLSEALRSRSITRRQLGFSQENIRSVSDRLGFRQPQAEQVLELG
jgi:hypothetical protein